MLYFIMCYTSKCVPHNVVLCLNVHTNNYFGFWFLTLFVFVLLNFSVNIFSSFSRFSCFECLRMNKFHFFFPVNSKSTQFEMWTFQLNNRMHVFFLPDYILGYFSQMFIDAFKKKSLKNIDFSITNSSIHIQKEFYFQKLFFLEITQRPITFG